MGGIITLTVLLIISLIMCTGISRSIEFDAFEKVKVPFKSFEKWYAICPRNYECGTWRVAKIISSNSFGEHKICLEFNVFGWCQYLLWRLRRKSENRRLESNNTHEILIISIQKDIDEFRLQTDTDRRLF